MIVDPRQGHSPGPPVLALAREYPDGHILPDHSHERGQLVHAVRGVMEMTIDHQVWLIPPHRALWVPPNHRHCLRARGAVSLRSLYFSPDLSTQSCPSDPVAITVGGLLREMILRAVQVSENCPPDSHDARLLALIPGEISWSRRQFLSLPMPQDPRLARVCQGLLTDPADNSILAQWGERAGASARTLARLFQSELGMTFDCWRQQMRTLLALPRLAAGVPVTQVALDLGYDTPSAFSAMFRRQMGQTPRRFLTDQA